LKKNTDLGIKILKFLQTRGIFFKQTEYNTLLAKLAAEDNSSMIEHYFSEMFEKGVSPNSESFKIWFDMRSKTKDNKQILYALSKMIRAGILPSVQQLQTTLSICKDSKTPKEIINKIEDYIKAVQISEIELRTLLKQQPLQLKF